MVRQSGTRKGIERRCLEIVREELHLLSLSQLGHSFRDQMRPVLPEGKDVHSYVDFLIVLPILVVVAIVLAGALGVTLF